MADVRGFVGEQADYGGLYKAADTVMRNKEFEQTSQLRKESRQSQSVSDLNRFFDPRDYLTGTDYDPILVKKLDDALQEGYKLVSQGMNSADVFMTLGSKVSEINEYSQKAKQIDKNVQAAVGMLKEHPGYLTKNIYENAKKMAFHNEDGSLKDIRDVDPSEDFVTKYVKANPNEATDYSGFDSFIKGIQPDTYDEDVTTERAGKKIRHRIKYTAPSFMSLNRDEKGNLMTNEQGRPTGFSIMGEDVPDESGKKHRLMDQTMFNKAFGSRPAMMDRLRGDIDQLYKSLGKDAPDENTPEWNYMARKIAAEEFGSRSKGVITGFQSQTNDALRNAREQGKPDYKPKEDKTKVKGILD